MRWLSCWTAFSCALGIGLGSLTTPVFAESPRERSDASIATSFGARLGPVSKELAERLGLVRQGAVVESVGQKSLAARAGLRVGDVILAAGGANALAGPREAQDLLQRQPRGKPIRLQILRKGEPVDLEFSLPKTGGGGRPLEEGRRVPQERQVERKEATRVPRIGASVADARSGGALVRTVELEFPSALIEPGDVILSVNDRPVRSAKEMARIAEEAPSDAPLILRVRRHGQIRLIGLRLSGTGHGPTTLGAGPKEGEKSLPRRSADDAGS